MFPHGLRGKPVLSPDELVAHGDGYYVVLTVQTKKSYTEISKFLQEHNYPENHLLDWVDQTSFVEPQYFEFPELYRPNTVFVDGGATNGYASYRFAEWCGGAYSSIIVFEPNAKYYAECCKAIQDNPLANFQLINAGLWSQEGTAEFTELNNADSYITQNDGPVSYIEHFEPEANWDKPWVKLGDENKISIRTVALDDIVGDRTVGFIKMDIEGSELNALHGAKNTIIRDKPLLAICVYHLRGDLFAIMDYLHQLLPEYRFLLRHYSSSITETILYASVDL